MSQKVWFITGSSSGFGRMLVDELLLRDQLVVATARRTASLEFLRQGYCDQILLPTLDVTDPGQCETAVRMAIHTFGRIDVLINNAGFGAYGSIEEVPMEVVRQQFETNYFGVLNVLKEVLPVMRDQRSGTILNISSIAGWMSFAGSGTYGASKFALEGMSESLEAELRPLGIRTIIVEPGSFQTNFYGHNYRRIASEIEDYAETAGKTLEFFDSWDGNQPGDAQKAVNAMIDIAEHPNPPLRLLLGSDAYDRALADLDSVRQNFTEWEAISRSVDKS